MGVSEALAKRIAEAERKAQLAADKLKKLKSEQAAREARQRVIEAKQAKAAESRRIQEVGAVVKRAGLLDLDNTTLLGVLLIAADKLDDLAYLAEVRERGEAVLGDSKNSGGSAVTQATA